MVIYSKFFQKNYVLIDYGKRISLLFVLPIEFGIKNCKYKKWKRLLIKTTEINCKKYMKTR